MESPGQLDQFIGWNIRLLRISPFFGAIPESGQEGLAEYRHEEAG
jgi:hypothetical protein